MDHYDSDYPSKDNDGAEAGCLMAVVLCFIVGIVSFLIGNNYATKHEQTEIVKHGYAHYEVANDGSTSFVWNNETETSNKNK